MAPLKLIPTNHNTYQKVKYFYGSQVYICEKLAWWGSLYEERIYGCGESL